MVTFGGVVGAVDGLDEERRLKIFKVFSQRVLLHARVLREALKRELVARQIGNHREHGIQFLHVGNAVQNGQVTHQHLVNDVVTDVLPRVGLDFRVEGHFGIASVVDVVPGILLPPMLVYLFWSE